MEIHESITQVKVEVEHLWSTFSAQLTSNSKHECVQIFSALYLLHLYTSYPLQVLSNTTVIHVISQYKRNRTTKRSVK